MATMERLNELQDNLDSLIVSYLDLFDIYQSLQEDLSKHLSNGFFSLAQANFSGPNRGRYGQDHYDDRMTALRGVDITAPSDKITFSIKDLPDEVSSGKTDHDEKSEKGSTVSGLRNRKRPGPSLKPEGESVSKDAGTTTTTTNDQEKKAAGEEDEEPISKPNLKDPIRWFGILTPPSLRTAQSEFVASLPPMLSICGLVREIERQENEVRRARAEVRELRKELGVVPFS